MRDQQNTTPIRPGFIFRPQATCPIASTETGLWLDATGNLKRRNSDGSDTTVSNAGDVQVIAVKAVAASALASNVYDNGTLGVGATLTKSTNGALGTIDGVTMVVGDYMLVAAESADLGNGLYSVTSLGGAGKWKLTRVPLFDSSAEIIDGTLFVVGQGSTYADSTWRYTGATSPVVGTDSLTFALAPISISYGAAGDMAAAGVTTANAAGVSVKVSRTDHVHAPDTAVIATLTGAQELTSKTVTAQVVKTGLTASGSAANDYSGSTGTFLTSTGLNTIGGDLLMASGKIAGFGAPQALSGAGACNVTSLVTNFTSTGGAQALTLANGTQAGQLKVVHHTVDGGSGVLTPATAGNFATFTLTNVHDAALFQWTGSVWNIVLNVGGTVA